MQHKPAAPAFAWAIALVGGGLLMTLFFFADDGAGGGVLGLVALFAGIVCALAGLLRLAMNVDFLTEREIARADAEQRDAGETHEERMARIRSAAQDAED